MHEFVYNSNYQTSDLIIVYFYDCLYRIILCLNSIIKLLFIFSVSADLLEVREPAIFIEFENIPLERIGIKNNF